MTPPTVDELRRTFFEKLAESDRGGARRLVARALNAGVPPERLLSEVVAAAVDELGTRLEEGQPSLSLLYVVGRIVEDCLDTLGARARDGSPSLGRVVIGTAHGDLHGLGRRIVSAFLRVAGFEVTDLGLSVPARTFAEEASRLNATIVAVSALMADTALGIRSVREELDRRDLRDTPLLVGGAPFRSNPALAAEVGATATAADAFAAMKVAADTVRQRRRRETTP